MTPTKTPREILEEIKYNFLNYNGVHTKEYMYDFLVTKPMLALLEEARQEEREKNKNFYNGVTEYILIHSPSPEEIQNYIDNNLPEF